jgi:hypothetical protein
MVVAGIPLRFAQTTGDRRARAQTVGIAVGSGPAFETWIQVDPRRADDERW